MSNSLEKILIKVLNGKQQNDEIECKFNPTEYKIEKNTSYNQHNTLLNTPQQQYVGGKPDVLTMELFFDTTEDNSDVRTYTDKIDSLLEVDGELHAPPLCKVIWGGGLEFKSVLAKADTQFIHFRSNGVPVRARVSVQFVQHETAEYQKSEIKHESTDKTKQWTVTDGDTLWLIAQEEYNDPAHWRTIAEANDIENPRTLEPGEQLSLPPL